MKDTLHLDRFCDSKQGTFGQLTLPDGWKCYVCEPPWAGNAVSESCIPTGVYELRMRLSEVVEHTTDGQHTEGWEVKDVPGRTFIMIHPGNHIGRSEGCLLPGDDLSGWSGRWAVTNSKDTFAELMKRLKDREVWTIDIRWAPAPEYP